MSELAVHTEGLTKIYKGDLGRKDVLGLDDLHLEVKEGEVFAFLGPNGAGKTTAIKLLTRLLHPTRGKVWILGRENSNRTAMENVGYMPEQPQLYGYLSGREFLHFVGQIFGLKSQERQKRITRLLDRVGLSGRAEGLLRNYSRGMIQRIALAQALMNDPQLLILDEPMASLDPVGRKDFRDLILELRHKGKTIFFSSHILSDAEMIADRVGIVNQGKLVSVGKLDDLVTSQVASVEVTFTIDPGKLDQIDLKTEDAVVRHQKVMIRVGNEQDIPKLLHRIDGWGGRVIAIVPQKKTLEDVFMAELGR
jgi:ABC-2 type transport system ATP-binding protein